MELSGKARETGVHSWLLKVHGANVLVQDVRVRAGGWMLDSKEKGRMTVVIVFRGLSFIVHSPYGKVLV